MKRTIYLKESELKRMIAESVRRIINEEYEDLASTSGLSGYEYNMFFKQYNNLKQLINSNMGEWDFLHSTEDWYKFFNRLKDIPQQMCFHSENKKDINQDVINELKQFARKCQNIPYPELSIAGGTSFVDKANSIKKCLKYAYKLYDDFINYLLSRHDNADIKQKDMDSDWSDFENNRQDFVNNTRKRAEDEYSFRRLANPFGRDLRHRSLDRYIRAIDSEK